MRGLLIMMLALVVFHAHAQKPSEFPDGLVQGMEYYKAGDMKNAVINLEKALPHIEKFSSRYELVLECLGMAYLELKDMDNVSRIMSLTQEHNIYQLSLPCHEVGCMIERAEHYAAIGNSAEAKSWYLKALGLPLEKEDAYKVHASYGKFLGMTMKDYGPASDYCYTAAQIRAAMGLKDEEYAGVLYSAALYFYFDNQNEKAIDTYAQVMDFFSDHKENKSARKNIALCHEGIARSYSVLRNFDKAFEYYLEALKYYENEDISNDKYPKIIAHVAKSARYNKDYKTAIPYYEKALKIFEERGMVEDYSSTATSLNRCYSLAGVDKHIDEKEVENQKEMFNKLDRIISEEKAALELTKQYLGDLAYARSLSTIAGCYVMKEEYSNAVDYFEQYIQSLRGALQYEFRMQNESERMITWKREQETLQEIKELLLLLPDGYETEFSRTVAMVYDAELLLKGMLLNSSIEFDSVIRRYADSKLISKYQQTKDNEEKISRLRATASTDEDLAAILRLTEENRKFQMDIYKKCAEYKDYTEYISYSWQDVRNALQSDALAIEFSILKASPLKNDASIVMLVVDRNMASPLVVPICNLAEAELLTDYDALFDEDWPGEAIWGRIKPVIEGKKKIYFSVEGVFHKCGIEYLKYNGKPFSEQYEVYRVSSTKELCRERKKTSVRKAVLFGSIDYYGKGSASSKSSNKRAAVTNGVYSDLENTAYEINEISKILKSSKLQPKKFLEDKADEGAFLALDNSDVGIIHIATHGASSSNVGISDDEAMNKSFLVFAGANVAGHETSNDGLITAAEVASMNLRMCDLAVLSACETGLGALGTDGVFGLQRGFKNAGVRTLLMSLKEVYDDSTAEMMVRFYKHLMNGLSKREALVQAQKEIRELGYTDSIHWASFILLDAF